MKELESWALNLMKKVDVNITVEKKPLRANNQNDWNCFFTLRHMLRDKRCLPHPDRVFSNEEPEKQSDKRKNQVRLGRSSTLSLSLKEKDTIFLDLKIGYHVPMFLTDKEKETLSKR